VTPLTQIRLQRLLLPAALSSGSSGSTLPGGFLSAGGGTPGLASSVTDPIPILRQASLVVLDLDTTWAFAASPSSVLSEHARLLLLSGQGAHVHQGICENLHCPHGRIIVLAPVADRASRHSVVHELSQSRSMPCELQSRNPIEDQRQWLVCFNRSMSPRSEISRCDVLPKFENVCASRVPSWSRR
jgi:hypothetical protein